MTIARPGLLAALVGAALAASCAPLSAPAGGAAKSTTSKGTAVREDLSGRFIELIGAKAQHDPPYLDTPGTNFYCLRSFVDRKTGETASQLYVADSYDGNERDWDAAYDASGKPLHLVAISRLEITCKPGCSYAEEFAADIPQQALLTSAHGFEVTFADRAGDRKAIRVSAAQVTAMLAALRTQDKSGSAPDASEPASPE